MGIPLASDSPNRASGLNRSRASGKPYKRASGRASGGGQPGGQPGERAGLAIGARSRAVAREWSLASKQACGQNEKKAGERAAAAGERAGGAKPLTREIEVPVK